MPSDKIVLEITSEKVNTDYTPSYIPFFPVLTKTQKYTEIIGEVKLKETKIIGDAVARKINTQDTEWKHAKTGLSQKDFRKYLSGIKYIVSGFQDNSDLQKSANQLLDTNLMAFDKNVFYGDPMDDGTLRNNGLWASTDPNYIANAPASMSGTKTLNDWKKLIDDVVAQAEGKVGNAPKTIGLVGAMTTKLGGFVDGTATTYARAIINALADEGKQVKFEAVPSNITLGTADSGLLVITPTKVLHRYVALPYIKNQDYNQEDEYTWLKLIAGSSMVDVEESGAIIKQPVTF